MEGENLAPKGIRSPDRTARSESLYQLSYPGPQSHTTQIKKKLPTLIGQQNRQLIHLLMEYFKLGIVNHKLLEFFVTSLRLFTV